MVIMTRRQARLSAIFGGKSAGRKDRRNGDERMNSYQTLANGIIVQAVKDYRAARKTLRRHPRSMNAAATITEIEAFFHSKWFKMLTDTDPAYILDQLRKEEH
jgi:hypothetical protein